MDPPDYKPSASTYRPLARTNLPVPQSKPGLNEMTESQHNIRTGLPLPSSNMLKHKNSDFVDPPAKRKIVEPAQSTAQPTGIHRPPSAQSIARPGTAAGQLRPPSRVNGHSQSLANPRLAQSTTTRPASIYTSHSSNTSRSQLSQSVYGQPRGHVRAKSQMAVSRQATSQDASGASLPKLANDWDNKGIEGRIALVEGLYESLKTQMEGTSFERSSMKELMEAMRVRILELEALKEKHEGMVATLRSDNDENKVKASQLQFENDQMRRNHETELDDIKRKYRYELDDLRDQHRHEIDRLHRSASDDGERAKKEARDEINSLREKHEKQIADLERRQQDELEDEKCNRQREVAELTKERDAQIETIATTIGRKEREADAVRDDLNQKMAEIERERAMRASLEARLEQKALECLDLESSNKAMKAKINFLESDNQQQSQQFVNLHQETREAVAARDEALQKLRKEETLRRKLHNEIQELKGNIRVFCRVRPVLQHEEEEPAKIDFPDENLDCREVVVMGQEQKSSLGTVTTNKYAFAFDRVFGPASDNGQIFDEVSQLIQSALDGYNCCIFSYGQTGTGKSYLMSSADGMIPRAVAQIYEQARALEERGWRYKMEGSFVEVYNENLNDLLGTAEDLDQKKLEIRHDTQRLKTAITGVTVVELDGPEAVEDVLRRADRNRSVAATKANQRSSRSHSVFILSLAGVNEITGERSEGTLNLVDLAGSERLAHSQAEGQRLKETQNINKSLSCLGDVIGALGRGDSGHVPYRNSKLTYLLQYSLGGNSKTLMFVMISPLQAHLGETLTSLKFATKVHNTHIGTAKRQVRAKE